MYKKSHIIIAVFTASLTFGSLAMAAGMKHMHHHKYMKHQNTNSDDHYRGCYSWDNNTPSAVTDSPQ